MSFRNIILLIIVEVAGYLVIIYNRFISLRTGIDAAWSDMDVQLFHRHRLGKRREMNIHYNKTRKKILGPLLLLISIIFTPHLLAHGNDPLLLDSLSKIKVEQTLNLAEKLLKEESEMVIKVIYNASKKQNIGSIASSLYGEFPLDRAKKVFGSNEAFFHWADDFKTVLNILSAVDSKLVNSSGEILPKKNRTIDEKIQILVAQKNLPMMKPYLSRVRVIANKMMGE